MGQRLKHFGLELGESACVYLIFWLSKDSKKGNQKYAKERFPRENKTEKECPLRIFIPNYLTFPKVAPGKAIKSESNKGHRLN